MINSIINRQGASKGIGKHIALHLSRESKVTHIAITARSESDLLQLAKELKDINNNLVVHTITADLSKPDAAKHIIESSVAAFDQINLLILNAGIFPTSLIADDNVVEDYVRTYQVNLFSSVSATKYAIPYLRKSKGTIIYISSLAAQQAIGGFSAYGSSKAALNHFVASVGNEEKDITSISIGPGSVATDKAMETLDHDSGKLDKNLAQALRTMREEGKLVQPDNVGKIIARFSLLAPLEWSGRFILDINTDEEVNKLISVQ